MKNKFPAFTLILVTLLALTQLGMARRGQYDEEARLAEKEAKRQQKEAAQAEKEGRTNPLKGIASGVKQATVDSAADVISETAESTREDAPVLGTLEGARQSTGKILDNTVKGVAKVATLGYGEVDKYEVVEPKKNSDDTTTVKIKF